MSFGFYTLIDLVIKRQKKKKKFRHGDYIMDKFADHPHILLDILIQNTVFILYIEI